MRLTESQLNRVCDQLRGYRLVLCQLAKISPDAALLSADTDVLLSELKRITRDDDIEHVLEALEVTHV